MTNMHVLHVWLFLYMCVSLSVRQVYHYTFILVLLVFRVFDLTMLLSKIYGLGVALHTLANYIDSFYSDSLLACQIAAPGETLISNQVVPSISHCIGAP